MNVFAGVMLVLLLACANVGNLLIARAVARRAGDRRAPVAGREPRADQRQLLTEGSCWPRSRRSWASDRELDLPRVLMDALSGRPTALRLEPDGLVLAYTLVLSAVATLLFGLAPALHATRTSVAGALKDDLPIQGCGSRSAACCCRHRSR